MNENKKRYALYVTFNNSGNLLWRRFVFGEAEWDVTRATLTALKTPKNRMLVIFRLRKWSQLLNSCRLVVLWKPFRVPAWSYLKVGFLLMGRIKQTNKKKNSEMLCQFFMNIMLSWNGLFISANAPTSWFL